MRRKFAMKHTALYLPTRGRPDNQYTLQKLPKALLERTTVVCPKSEAKAIGSQFPSLYDIKTPMVETLTAKRKWIFENTSFTKIIQLDDDLRFHARRYGCGTQLFAASHTDLIRMYDRLDWALQRYAHATVQSRFMSHMNRAEWKLNGRVCHVLGYDVATVLKHVDTGRSTIFQDADYTLQLFRAGYESAVYCGGTQEEERGWNAPGGVSTYRTAKLTAEISRKFVEWHPDLVRIDIPAKAQDKFQWGVKISFSWKRAIMEGLARRDVKYGTLTGKKEL